MAIFPLLRQYCYISIDRHVTAIYIWIILAVLPQFCQKGLLRQYYKKLACMRNPILPQGKYCSSIAGLCCNNIAAICCQKPCIGLYLVREVSKFSQASEFSLITGFHFVYVLQKTMLDRDFIIKIFIKSTVKYPLCICFSLSGCLSVCLSLFLSLSVCLIPSPPLSLPPFLSLSLSLSLRYILSLSLSHFCFCTCSEEINVPGHSITCKTECASSEVWSEISLCIQAVWQVSSQGTL